MSHAEPSHQKICTLAGVEQGLVQYLLDHQQWSVPRFTEQFWAERFQGAREIALRSMLSKLSQEGALIQVVAKTMPEELILRPMDGRPLRTLAPESSNNATARFLPTVATLEHFSREAHPSELEKYSWAIREVSRIVSVLQSSTDVRAMLRTNVPSEVKRVVDRITDRLAPEVAHRLNMDKQSTHAAVLTVLKNRSLRFPLSPTDERLIERSAWERLQMTARREVRAEFSSLRLPAWPKIEL